MPLAAAVRSLITQYIVILRYLDTLFISIAVAVQKLLKVYRTLWAPCMYKHSFQTEYTLIILNMLGDKKNAWYNRVLYKLKKYDNLQVNVVLQKR